MAVGNVPAKRFALDDLNRSEPALRTPGRMRVLVDPVNGNDSARFVLGDPEDDPAGLGRDFGPTWQATLKTFDGVLARLPSEIRHPVYVVFKPGTYSTTAVSGESFGPSWDCSRFRAVDSYPWFDPNTFEIFDNPAGIYLMHESYTTLIADTVANVFSSTTIGRNTLSLSLDAYRGKAFVEIVAGSGVGEYRRVKRNTVNGTFSPASAWITTPDGSSHFVVWEPNVILASGISVSGSGTQAVPAISVGRGIKLADPFTWNVNVADAYISVGCEIDGGDFRVCTVFHNGRIDFKEYDFYGDPLFMNDHGAYVHDGDALLEFGAMTGVDLGTIIADDMSFIISERCQSWIDKVDADGKGNVRDLFQLSGQAQGIAAITGADLYRVLKVTEHSYWANRGSPVYGTFRGPEAVLLDGMGSADIAAATGTGSAIGSVGARVRGGGKLFFQTPTLAGQAGASSFAFLGNDLSGALRSVASVTNGHGATETEEGSSLIRRAGP